ncbi:MAG: hypothetical protein U0K35_00165, partial [Prevotella sp.]|nr:hypothetical protein [Prevotella sp.]
KLVYIWLSMHIIMLAEHPPISCSFLFFSIREHPLNPCSAKAEMRKQNIIRILFTNKTSKTTKTRF